MLKTKDDQIWIFLSVLMINSLEAFLSRISIHNSLLLLLKYLIFCSQFLQACKNLFIL